MPLTLAVSCGTAEIEHIHPNLPNRRASRREQTPHTHVQDRDKRRRPQETSENVPLGTIDLGSFEVLSDNGDTVEDDVVVESSEEAPGTMPPLPLALWFKKTKTSKHSEPWQRLPRRRRVFFFVCWDWRHEQSDVLQQADPWAQNAPKSVSSAKGCFSVNFPVCWGVKR